MEYSKNLKARKTQRQGKQDQPIEGYPYNDDYGAFITSLETFVTDKITANNSPGKLMNILAGIINSKGIQET